MIGNGDKGSQPHIGERMRNMIVAMSHMTGKPIVRRASIRKATDEIPAWSKLTIFTKIIKI